jgi:hypothetical protein
MVAPEAAQLAQSANQGLSVDFTEAQEAGRSRWQGSANETGCPQRSYLPERRCPMSKKNTSLSKTAAAVAFVGLLICGPQVLAQGASPGGGDRAPETKAAPPATPPQAPTMRPEGGAGPGSMTVGRVPGHTGQVSTVEVKPDRVVEQSEKEVSRRIKNICRGC